MNELTFNCIGQKEIDIFSRIGFLFTATLLFVTGFWLGDDGSRAIRDPLLGGDFGDISSWSLYCNAGEQHPPIRLFYLPDGPDILHASTGKTYKNTWDVQLSHRGFKIEKDKRYVVSFRMCCQQPTTINMVMNLSQPPWTNLGLGDTLPVRKEWVNYATEFTANKTDANATLQFNLGTSAAPNTFSLADVRLSPAIP
jgi:hypothetical protein